MIDEKEMFSDKNIPESNWFKFDKVGVSVYGEVEAMFDKEARDLFPAQRCFTLRTADGSLINVGVKKTSNYLMSRTSNVALGDTIGFKFVKTIPPTKKGLNPAKSIEVFVKKAEVTSEGEE